MYLGSLTKYTCKIYSGSLTKYTCRIYSGSLTGSPLGALGSTISGRRQFLDNKSIFNKIQIVWFHGNIWGKFSSEQCGFKVFLWNFCLFALKGK